ATGVGAAEHPLRLPLGTKKMVHSIVVLAATTAAVSIASTDGVCARVTTHATQARRDPAAPLGFVPSPSRFGGPQHTRRRGLPRSPGHLELSAQGSDERERGESRHDSGVAVHDDSWHLGDGGFAERHLEDEARLAAKQDEKDFFRKRSLSVYDQMKEASMLLLAQQQILAAEEAREESSKPRFVAAAGGSMAARAQAARDRQKKRASVAGLLADAPAPVSVASASTLPEKGGGDGSSRGSGPASPVMVPVGPGMLSGDSLGVGGLDEELEEIRRRVCVPLAAPEDLLEDLGISPVRGLLLYGPPGCGKTLLARRLSAALTPRPPAVVSGPEILERFVGSSEANIRALFDFPPDVPGGDAAEQEEALHVIVMDEFDSIGQRRGGGDDGGDRVRDSVVNQLLARMDGFQELDRPTLLVALTNRIDLLDTALLRPGRFEVQVHIPGPDASGREAILRIHTRRMHRAGRIETVRPDSEKENGGGDDGYETLVSSLAAATEGFTGAELAGLVRAAASYALERAVGGGGGGGAAGCRVTSEDFARGLADVTRSKSSADQSKKGGAKGFSRAAAAAAGVGATAATAGGSGERSDGATSIDSTASAKAVAPGEARAGGDGGGVSPRGRSAAAVAQSISATAVAAARSEGGIGGSLSPEDLESIQQLLLQKTSRKEDEDVLLLDAARVVAERRKSVPGGGKGQEG
ncbi:unnamed protein product, partial [Scytosiphon promiscuus]